MSRFVSQVALNEKWLTEQQKVLLKKYFALSIIMADVVPRGSNISTWEKLKTGASKKANY